MYKKHPIVNKALNKIYENIPDNCICIRNKIYNINNFEHPGGNTFILINKGCDITTLFETHHLSIERAEKLLKTLEKDYVGDYYSTFNYDFTFYRNLRSKVSLIFNTKKKRNTNFINKSFLIFYLLLGIYLHNSLLKHTNFSFNYLLTCFATSFINTILGGFGHNGIHKLLYSSLLLDWNGLSSVEWLLEHVHSHHMYTNTENDHDSISMRPFLNWIPDKTRSIFGSKGKHLIYLIAELVVPIQGLFIHRFRWSILFKKEYPVFLRLAPLLFIFRIYIHLYYQGFIFGSLTIIICLMIAGYYFAYLAHLNHAHNENVVNESNESDSIYKDYVIHQLEQTNDIKIPNYLQHMFLNLDRQTIHHLFPTIDHCHLKKVKKIIKRVLEENLIVVKSKNICKLNNEINKILDYNKKNVASNS